MKENGKLWLCGGGGLVIPGSDPRFVNALKRWGSDPLFMERKRQNGRKETDCH